LQRAQQKAIPVIGFIGAGARGTSAILATTGPSAGDFTVVIQKSSKLAKVRCTLKLNGDAP
jgi:hypothetical protein